MTERSVAIARSIFSSHQNAETFTNLTGELSPENLESAYAAQWALHELHASEGRGVVGGRKIALASAVQQELCGIDHPIAGAIFENEIHSSPQSLVLSAYHGLGIEYEIAVSLTADTEPGREYKTHEIRELIGGIHPAFEMIIDRGADYNNIDPLTMIADNAWCAGIVLGSDISGETAETIDDLPVTLTWNDEVETGSTAASDPVGTLTWVVNLLSGLGQVLKAGQPVITGSVLQTRYPVAGDTIRFAVDNHAEVVLTIT